MARPIRKTPKKRPETQVRLNTPDSEWTGIRHKAIGDGRRRLIALTILDIVRFEETGSTSCPECTDLVNKATVRLGESLKRPEKETHDSTTIYSCLLTPQADEVIDRFAEVIGKLHADH